MGFSPRLVGTQSMPFNEGRKGLFALGKRQTWMATGKDIDNASSSEGSETAYGQAALILIESLIHGLCERDFLSTNEAIEIVERATDIQSEHAEEARYGQSAMWQAHELLRSIATSLHIDGQESSQS